MATEVAEFDNNFTMEGDTQSPVQYYYTYNGAPYQLGYADSFIPFEDYWRDSSELSLILILKAYIPPILIAIGSLGNVLAFVVLIRSHLMQQSSICFYVAVLTVTNTLVLYVGCGLEWVSFLSKKPQVANLNDTMCRVWKFIFNVVRYSSNWLVLAMVIDRCIVTWAAQKAQTLCTVFIAKVVTIIIFIGLLVIYIHAMWTYELTRSGCSIDPSRRDFEAVAWPWIAASLSSYIPIIVISTVLIALIVGRCCSAETQANNAQSQGEFSRLTICMAIFFLVCSLPTVILNFVQYARPRWFFSFDLISYQKRARFYLVQVISGQLECFYISFCFVLYFAVARILWRELCSTLESCCRCCCRSRSQPGQQELEVMDANGRLLTANEGVATDAPCSMTYV